MSVIFVSTRQCIMTTNIHDIQESVYRYMRDDV